MNELTLPIRKRGYTKNSPNKITGYIKIVYLFVKSIGYEQKAVVL
jgi:hypothetical protein